WGAAHETAAATLTPSRLVPSGPASIHHRGAGVSSTWVVVGSIGICSSEHRSRHASWVASIVSKPLNTNSGNRRLQAVSRRWPASGPVPVHQGLPLSLV